MKNHNGLLTPEWRMFGTGISKSIYMYFLACVYTLSDTGEIVTEKTTLPDSWVSCDVRIFQFVLIRYVQSNKPFTIAHNTLSNIFYVLGPALHVKWHEQFTAFYPDKNITWTRYRELRENANVTLQENSKHKFLCSIEVSNHFPDLGYFIIDKDDNTKVLQNLTDKFRFTGSGHAAIFMGYEKGLGSVSYSANDFLTYTSNGKVLQCAAKVRNQPTVSANININMLCKYLLICLSFFFWQ